MVNQASDFIGSNWRTYNVKGNMMYWQKVGIGTGARIYSNRSVTADTIERKWVHDVSEGQNQSSIVAVSSGE